MKTYNVIWRGDEDDFFITALDLEPSHYDTLNNNQIVQMCWDVEYPAGEDDWGPNPFVGENPASYDLIDIFTGDNIKFVSKS